MHAVAFLRRHLYNITHLCGHFTYSYCQTNLFQQVLYMLLVFLTRKHFQMLALLKFYNENQETISHLLSCVVFSVLHTSVDERIPFAQSSALFEIVTRTVARWSFYIHGKQLHSYINLLLGLILCSANDSYN